MMLPDRRSLPLKARKWAQKTAAVHGLEISQPPCGKSHRFIGHTDVLAAAHTRPLTSCRRELDMTDGLQAPNFPDPGFSQAACYMCKHSPRLHAWANPIKSAPAIPPPPPPPIRTEQESKHPQQQASINSLTPAETSSLPSLTTTHRAIQFESVIKGILLFLNSQYYRLEEHILIKHETK